MNRNNILRTKTVEYTYCTFPPDPQIILFSLHFESTVQHRSKNALTLNYQIVTIMRAESNFSVIVVIIYPTYEVKQRK